MSKNDKSDLYHGLNTAALEEALLQTFISEVRDSWEKIRKEKSFNLRKWLVGGQEFWLRRTIASPFGNSPWCLSHSPSSLPPLITEFLGREQLKNLGEQVDLMEKERDHVLNTLHKLKGEGKENA